MTTTLPTRQQVEQAGDLDFDAQRSAGKAHISIELAPDGLHITAEYLGTLGSIPAAVKRMVDAGLLDLVATHRAAPAAPSASSGAKPKAQKVEPEYNGAGEACCPKHKKPLREGKFGLYCPAKDESSERGYCALRFAE